MVFAGCNEAMFVGNSSWRLETQMHKYSLHWNTPSNCVVAQGMCTRLLVTWVDIKSRLPWYSFHKVMHILCAHRTRKISGYRSDLLIHDFAGAKIFSKTFPRTFMNALWTLWQMNDGGSAHPYQSGDRVYASPSVSSSSTFAHPANKSLYSYATGGPHPTWPLTNVCASARSPVSRNHQGTCKEHVCYFLLAGHLCFGKSQ